MFLASEGLLSHWCIIFIVYLSLLAVFHLDYKVLQLRILQNIVSYHSKT